MPDSPVESRIFDGQDGTSALSALYRFRRFPVAKRIYRINLH